MTREPVFSDNEYPEALMSYALGEMSERAWDAMMRRPLFRIWFREVLHHHFARATPARQTTEEPEDGA